MPNPPPTDRAAPPRREPVSANGGEAGGNSLFRLFFRRCFLPLFIAQFFGAFNDNFLKCAILTLVAFHGTRDASRAGLLTNLAMAIFIAPFFFFSASAGQLTDRVDKARCCRAVKAVEVVLMLLVCPALIGEHFGALLVLLGLMGAQSAFFGPAKYALLPQLLRGEPELLASNALIGGGTFLTILLGSIAGSWLVMLPGGRLLSGGVLAGFAVVGYAASRFIPAAPPVRSVGRRFRFRPLADTRRILAAVFRRPELRQCILSVSGFWLVGSLYVSQLPVLCRDTLGVGHQVYTLFLALFSIGVAVGALLVSRLQRGRIAVRTVLPAGVGIAILSLDLAVICGGTAAATTPAGLEIFGSSARLWRVAIDLFGIAVCGGLFSVPLQTAMQYLAPRALTARVIAANNIVNSSFMAGGALLTAAAVQLPGVGPRAVFFAIVPLALYIAVAGRKVGKFLPRT